MFHWHWHNIYIHYLKKKIGTGITCRTVYIGFHALQIHNWNELDGSQNVAAHYWMHIIDSPFFFISYHGQYIHVADAIFPARYTPSISEKEVVLALELI